MAGCYGPEAITKALGMQGPYLFYGFDTIVLPGQPADIAVRLQKGPYLNDEEGVLVRFELDGRFVALSRTDDEGYARATFTPSKPGNYFITARTVGGDLEKPGPEPAKVLVACREADTPIAVIDIDKTLVSSSFDKVLSGEAEAMTGSKAFLDDLAQSHTLLYLTLRLDYFGPKTKRWLDEHEYPTGPLWVSRFHGLFQGNRDFRRERIRKLRRDFVHVKLGLGDKISDAVAYLANEMTAALIVQPERISEADTARELASKLELLPERTIVVSSFEDLRKALEGDSSFSPKRMAGRLRDRARTLESQ
jgi:hypothetical protein